MSLNSFNDIDFLFSVFLGLKKIIKFYKIDIYNYSLNTLRNLKSTFSKTILLISTNSKEFIIIITKAFLDREIRVAI